MSKQILKYSKPTKIEITQTSKAMIRVTKMSGKYYGVELTDDLEKEMEQIEGFVNQGTPVIIVNSEADLEDLDIYEEIIMVDREE